MGSDTARIKGVAFREFLVFLERERGAGFLKAAFLHIPAQHRVGLDVNREALGALPSTWYEGATVHALLDAVSAGLSDAERERLANAGSRAVMSVTLSGIHKRLISMFVSPATYARFASKLWRSYYDSGDFTVELAADGKKATTTIKGWLSHHPLACTMNVEAAIAIFGAMGQQEVRTERVACVARGADACRFVSSWR